MATEANIFISIAASLREKFEGYDEGLLQERVNDYAKDLWKAISGGMEEAPIRVQWSEDVDSKTLLTINGVKGIIPDVFASRLPFMNATEHFIQYVCKGLLINRALFVTDDLIENYFPHFSAFTDQESEAIRRLAKLFVEFGYSVSWLSKTNAHEISDKPLYQIFEKAVQGYKAVSVALIIHPDMQQRYHVCDRGSGGENLSLMCEGIYQQYGVLIPKVSMQYDSEIPLYHGRVQFNQLPLAFIKTVDADYFVCNQPSEDASLNFDHPVTPGHPNTSGTFSLRTIETLEQDRYSVWGSWGVWILQISGLVRQYAGWFCNGFAFDTIWDATMQNPMGNRLLEKYDKLFLTHVLRRLHQQGLFTRNVYRVMEGVFLARQAVLSDTNTIEFFHHPMVLAVDISPADAALNDPVYIAEGVRNYLRYELVANLGFPSTFLVLLIDPSFENALFGNEDYMQLMPALIEELEFEIRHFQSNGVLHGILTIDAIRHRLEDMLRETYPFLKVIAYNELPAEANIQPISRLTPAFPEKDEAYESVT